MENTRKPGISVIIPTLNAGGALPALLRALKAQTLQADEIIVVDSSSTDGTAEICKAEQVRVFEVRREDFDHGRTRDMALRMSSGDIVVFLTQDAMPANGYFLERLVAPLAEEDVAVSTGRQLPREDASRMERLVRRYNYPAESSIRSKADVPRMGIKTFFCSDVCAAYNRRLYMELGGFDYPIKTNEDMLFAAKVINGGLRIAYAADALVYHSHNFTLREQYRRNWIQGYEIRRHAKALNHVPQESEGIKMVKAVSAELLRHGDVLEFMRFGLDCCARLMGSRAGERAYLKEMRKQQEMEDPST